MKSTPTFLITCTSAIFCLSSHLTLSAAPVLSEIVAINGGEIEDRNDDLPAWVEIYNPQDEVLDLAGYYLTNDPEDPTKYVVPKLIIQAKGYGLIFLSGKNFHSLFENEVHTSFSFGVDDEYFAIVGPDGTTVADALEEVELRLGMSYGRPDPSSEETTLFKTPTPRQANRDPILGVVADTKFSVDRGYYTEPITVEITCKTEDARIIYTTSGRAPSEGSIFTGPIEHVYDGPITIDKTTVLRAAAFKDGYAPSNVDTQTYLFLEDVPDQEDMRTSVTESDTYGPQMVEALSALPSISLTAEVLRDVTTGNARVDPTENDEEYATSVEWLNPDGEKGFQIDAGISRFGGYFTDFPKKSFRLHFRKRYGAAKLRYPVYRGHEVGIAPAEEFNAIHLRSGSHDMNQRGAYLSNRFTDDTLLEMGHIAPHGRFVHVYINGTYWGQYHLRERWNADMLASYFGGEEEDYEAINGNNVGSEFLPGTAYDGDGSFWREALTISKQPMPFANLQNHIDMGSYFGFQLAWVSGNSESEFQSGGSRSLGVPFKFYFKDADGYLRPQGNRLSNKGPGDIFKAFRDADEPDFRMALADAIYKHYFNGGAFTKERLVSRLQRRVDETQKSFIAESARWGFRTPNAWQSFQDNLLNSHLPKLNKDMVRAFRNAGWYPDVTAPIYTQRGGEIEPGYTVRINAGTIFSPQKGEIFFTLDGSDPRAPGGAKASGALTYDRTGPGVALHETTTVKSRLRDPDGHWSALMEATFHIGRLAEAGDLIISELHYRPSAPNEAEQQAGFDSRSAFEFIEIYNRSEDAISITDIAFVDGVRFDFANATMTHLQPGALGLVVANRDAFELRYGTDLPVLGEFHESRLSNGGETIRLAEHSGSTLLELRYDDKDPWPEAADGEGKSLTLKRPAEVPAMEAPDEWRASGPDGGTPGALEGDDPTPGDDPLEDRDGDGLPAYAEWALGSSDEDATSGANPMEVTRRGDGSVTIVLPVAPSAQASQFQLESSTDLQTWTSVHFTLVDGAPEDGSLQWDSAELADSELFVRLRITAP